MFFEGELEGAEDGRGRREVLLLFLKFSPCSPVPPVFQKRKAVVLSVFWWP